MDSSSEGHPKDRVIEKEEKRSLHEEQQNQLSDSLRRSPVSDNEGERVEEAPASSLGGNNNKETINRNNKNKKRRNSLELRKLPTHVLLTNEPDYNELHRDESNHGGSRTQSTSTRSLPGDNQDSSYVFLRKTCLNSNFNLRTQMMLSFGLVSAFAILLVVTVCIVVSIMSGNKVNDITRKSFSDFVLSKEGITARYIAESLTLRLLPTDLVQITHEATRDRFAGYPTFADDSQVPFMDSISRKNMYPVRGKPMPLDWEILDGGNVNETTFHEHVQDRYSWYQKGSPLSTENAVYFMQGVCDPSITDPREPTYWEDCSDRNNNITTGGAIAPSPTNEQIYRKAADLVPLLKSLYEFYSDVKEIGIYFMNSGAGATMFFPHYQLNTSNYYESIGCNWLLEPHPYDNSRLIGTMEDHSRCENNGIHIRGEKVSTRQYNPMDRDWCRNQAQNPDKIQSYGPYLSAWHESEWLMSIGRALYDRVTKNFIGCIGIDYSLSAVESALKEGRPTVNSEVTLVRLDDFGTVVASSAWNKDEVSRNIAIDELPVGVSKQTLNLLKELIDFETKWEPDTVRSIYENYHVQEGGFSITGFPMPPPPNTYDSSYRPEFLVISSLSQYDVENEVQPVSESVADTVAELISLALGVGFIGLAAVVVFIFIVSHAITFPLNYMNEVSSDIVNTFGNHKDDGIETKKTTLESRCSPKTELSDVVKQFQKMVSRFSGSAMAKSMQVNVDEIQNHCPISEGIFKIYSSRSREGFPYNFQEPLVAAKTNKDLGEYSGSTSRVHFGSVINDGTKSDVTFRTSDVKQGGTSLTSPLFFWIVALIVGPMLITTVTISTFVTYSISEGLFDIISEAKAEYIFLTKYALSIHSLLRAMYSTQAMRQAVRDNFLLTRYASWLLFDGLERTDSFTELLGGTNECKHFRDLRQCGAISNYTCDCAWNDMFLLEGTCEDFEDSRRLQKTTFYGLSEDILPDGDRVVTSYPKLAYSAESTQWWTGNFSGLPGAEKGSNASGYDTTYDRMRVSSAMPIFQTLYNSDEGNSYFISGTIFFEADGLGVGYRGCSADHLRLSEWFSTESNWASELRPNLCPIGKHGYDPRCREWYDRGMHLALNNNSGFYLTPPYLFAGSTDQFFGQTCTSPLIDPRTGTHVGQTLLDFVSGKTFDALSPKNTPLARNGFPVLITGLSDRNGANTVIGPGFSLTEDASVPIGDILLPYDSACKSSDPNCIHRARFETNILAAMNEGTADDGQFLRTTADGSVETVHIAWAPVMVKVLIPKNSSDFSRGVHVSDFLVYSLALAEPEDSMVAPFSKVESEVHKQIDITIAVLALVIFLSTAFVIYVSNFITSSMTEPMIYLLKMILHINRSNVDGSPPDVELDNTFGSKETINVVGTMQTLYRIVQSANVAFFAGDVEKAYYVLSDAARLFKRLENPKAEGVALNNLGNTMLAFYRAIEDTDVDKVCGFSKRDVIGKGMAYYHQAIQLGEAAYDEFYEAEGWSPSCLDFMQHLSNRYFNRAMFLLSVKNGHEKPTEIEELGMRDLQIATDMDVEIVDQGTEVGWNVRGADKLFDVYLSRIRGHLLLLEIGYEDKWEIDELLDKAFKLVQSELSTPTSSLFNDFCPAGRMQQIETELMRFLALRGDLEGAAKIAVRMLVEDENTLEGAQLKAVEVLISHLRNVVEDEVDAKNPHLVQALEELEDYQIKLQQASEERERFDWDEDNLLPESLKQSMRNILEDSDTDSKMEPSHRDQFRLSSLRASTRGDVTMEIF